jgi:hypothetical protein
MTVQELPNTNALSYLFISLKRVSMSQTTQKKHLQLM